MRKIGSLSQANTKKKNGGVFYAFVLTLISLIIILAGLAVHLSKQVILKTSSSSQHHQPLKSIATIGHDEPEQHINIDKVHDVVLPNISNNNNESQDRVYCMIPFIWNEEIYKVIMDTWGKRCDVINFLTDSIVGGFLKGDKITEGEYKPYWEYPAATFPDNVKFINMTRTWHDCPVDKKGVKKVCRHIWEKMWRCEFIILLCCNFLFIVLPYIHKSHHHYL